MTCRRSLSFRQSRRSGPHIRNKRWDLDSLDTGCCTSYHRLGEQEFEQYLFYSHVKGRRKRVWLRRICVFYSPSHHDEIAVNGSLTTSFGLAAIFKYTLLSRFEDSVAYLKFWFWSLDNFYGIGLCGHTDSEVFDPTFSRHTIRRWIFYFFNQRHSVYIILRSWALLQIQRIHCLTIESYGIAELLLYKPRNTLAYSNVESSWPHCSDVS